MTDFNKIVEIKDDLQLLKELSTVDDEIGMIEFVPNDDIFPIPNGYLKIGNFEMDILAIRKLNAEIVMLDHDSPDCEIGKCAKDLRSFLRAIVGFINYMQACEKNEDLYDDFKQMEIVAKESAKVAGSNDYLWFYQMMFGI